MAVDLRSWLSRQTGGDRLEIREIDLGGQLDDSREWLIANGMGSYASAALSGANTRRYHGLFVAALDAPVRRTVLLSRLDETVSTGAEAEALATSYWQSGVVAPAGYEKLRTFTHEPVPTWHYELAGGDLIKQVAMLPGKQSVTIGYSWLSNEGKAARIGLAVIANYRDFHSQTRGSESWSFLQEPGQNRVRIKAFEGAAPMEIVFDRGEYTDDAHWYWSYFWPEERARGLIDTEDGYRTGILTATLQPGESLTLTVALDAVAEPRPIGAVVRDVAEAQEQRLELAGKPADVVVAQLVKAADSFVPERKSTGGSTIIAGYHWFGDWGRDSMISLPGLTLATGRAGAAQSILRTFGKYLSKGMLPNYFPDSGQQPAYNTIDATFWWAWALDNYLKATGDLQLVREQLPLLAEVIDWHERGTRHGIGMDEDGLITGGEAGVQLTWMDARVGDYVVTPRAGKAVEINALWYNFLRTTARFHELIAGSGDGLMEEKVHLEAASAYNHRAEMVARSFLEKFWNESTESLYDVIAPDGVADASLRPNQIFAASLPFTPLSAEKCRGVLIAVERELLTPYGLRSLSPSDPRYQARYGSGKSIANQYDRDITYHQGTIWPWLIGAWVDARVRVLGDDEKNLTAISAHLSHLVRHLFAEAGIGFISEIFDAEEPHVARGCIAQAWSVAELLRVAWRYPKLRLGVLAHQHLAQI